MAETASGGLGSACLLGSAHVAILRLDKGECPACYPPSGNPPPPPPPPPPTTCSSLCLSPTVSRGFSSLYPRVRSSHLVCLLSLSLSSVVLMMMMSWCLMSSDVIWHIRDKLWPMPKHGSIKSTYARCMRVLAVTCHLHFLAEWPGFFTCYCGNTGVERIPK